MTRMATTLAKPPHDVGRHFCVGVCWKFLILHDFDEEYFHEFLVIPVSVFEQILSWGGNREAWDFCEEITKILAVTQ